ncbi:hypothetical protein K469DRAFT_765360 [Zopfia rhizophila CBS 207.26]|uniref:NAD(P)-binding protein n=1 Tax=Zopfia rhizophila CBS 207.26 TaxID=1314779 RepID=A0A6A6D747_9PEZI|nr:hypothetical protein K469DRAFT_765360 [Zopfia rhizophila CBS 207.26]
MENSSMSGNTILIAGSRTNGIGNTLALEFQNEIPQSSRRREMLPQIVSLKDNSSVHLVPLDVSPLNNSGALSFILALDLSIDEAKGTLEVNFWGVIPMIQAFSRLLIAAKGIIENLGSSQDTYTLLSGVRPPSPGSRTLSRQPDFELECEQSAGNWAGGDGQELKRRAGEGDV